MVSMLESISIGGVSLATRRTEARRRARVMQMFVIGGNWRRTVTRAVIAGTLAASLVTLGTGSVCRADDEPKPDPAGIATGDRASVYDAGGNAFVVAEPTDKTAPDYAQKKKDFDEYQAQAEQGAAGGEAGRLRRPPPHRDQLRVDAQHRLPRALHAGRVRAAHLRPGAQEERRPPDDAQLRGLRLRVPRVLRGAASPSSSARWR